MSSLSDIVQVSPLRRIFQKRVKTEIFIGKLTTKWKKTKKFFRVQPWDLERSGEGSCSIQSLECKRKNKWSLGILPSGRSLHTSVRKDG